MSVTAKVLLSSKTLYPGGTVGLVFSADYADGRNKEWAQATPYLDYKMTVKDTVADLFPLGGKITVTFDLDESEQNPAATS